MPLVKVEDYPEGADTNVVDWCKYCGTKDNMNSYEQALKGMTEFMMKSQGMTEEQAKKAAEEALKNSAAYKDGRLK
ncbi:AraC family transcriptional regulator [Candidatus Dojkabacteria bacterium]|nr:AraC family transcriptional regulator [Candidatus Dojkabacteria bacterium]